MVASYAVVGLTVTDVTDGAEFPIDTLALTVLPVSVPSVGSTWHATVSPPLKPLDKVTPEPAVLPLMLHT